MRADRLVAILLMLQSRGQVTAAEVADELEISERTARRDLEALGMAGLPIYSRQGRNGGWQLAGGGRTDLSGLNAAEARALVPRRRSGVVGHPRVAGGVAQARPRPFPSRSGRRPKRRRHPCSSIRWVGTSRRRGERRSHLDAVQQAVVDGEQIVLGYVARDRAATTRVVHPLGLAAKGAVWYLVGDTEAGLRTFRVDRMTSVEPNGQPVTRPDGFDLHEAWKLITERSREQAHADHRDCAGHAGLGAVAALDPRARVSASVPPATTAASKWSCAVTTFARWPARSPDSAALVEILDPPEVRDLLGAIGTELVDDVHASRDATS